MLNSFCGVSIPEDLNTYYYVSNVIKERETVIPVDSEIVIKRDTNGCIASVNYYSPDKELVKEVFYNGGDITKINNYRGKFLYSTEEYQNSLLNIKYIFSKNGNLMYNIEYKYNKRNLTTSIVKKNKDRDVKLEYEYDDFNHIRKRIVFVNSERMLEQNFRYDILDRVVEYTDNNQHIIVNSISKKNELISYVITDKMGNKIKVENIFSGEKYSYTNITLNGHSSPIKDTSYVDNVMLKKPYTNEDDLDLLIVNLFKNNDAMHTTRKDDADFRSSKLVDNNIEMKALPISMRKRLLYNLTISKK